MCHKFLLHFELFHKFLHYQFYLCFLKRKLTWMCRRLPKRRKFVSCNLQDSSILSCNMQVSKFLWWNLQDSSAYGAIWNIAASNHNSKYTIAIYYRATCKIAFSYCAVCMIEISYHVICKIGISCCANCETSSFYRAICKIGNSYDAICKIAIFYHIICKRRVCYRPELQDRIFLWCS